MKWGKMKLDYNKVVSQVTDNFDLSVEEDLKKYKKLKEKKRRQDKEILGRSEWVYNLWYLHLKLCLEMEEKEIPIRLRKKYSWVAQPEEGRFKRKWTKKQWERQVTHGIQKVKEQRKVTKIHKLKINRKLYEGIDWEDLKTLSWNQWKKRYLNVFMTGGTREIKHGDEWKCEPQFLYLEMDIRNTETVLLNQLKKILKGRKTKNLPPKMGVQGVPNYHPTILGYNIVVSFIEGKDWIDTLMQDEILGRLELLFPKRIVNVKKDHYKGGGGDKDERDFMKELDSYLKLFMKGDYSLKNEFEGFCFTNLHRYILDTQRVLYNVSQGRFFDKTEIPKGKWKGKWSPKLYTW